MITKRMLHWPTAAVFIPGSITLFFSLYFLCNRLHNALCERVIPFPCVTYWPISEFYPRVPPNFGFPSTLHVLVGIVSVLLFIITLHALAKSNYHVVLVAASGMLLILSTTLTHGWQFGLVLPVAGTPLSTNDLYRQASAIRDPMEFMRTFGTIQPDLGVHSSTHPPGAILVFYFLQRLLPNPASIAIVIAIASVCLLSFFFHRLLLVAIDSASAGRVLFLLLLIPAIHIYFAASLDALITPLILGSCLMLFLKSNWSVVVSALCLIAASFLTFGFLFVLPVLFLFSLWQCRHIKRSLLVMAIIPLCYILLNGLTGFNYLNSFLTAARLENPGGFALLVSPATYVMTRIEDVAEVLFFFGPFLSILFFSALSRRTMTNSLMRLSVLALLSFLLVLLTGAYKTGETARASGFMYPFLMIPVGLRLVEENPTTPEFNTLAALVFGQTLLMQLAAYYVW